MIDTMDITVVIPTRNRAKMLSGLLDSLRVQKPEELSWEVLVIDNGSTDDTSSMMKTKIAGFPVPLGYIHEPAFGLHNGRNRGAKEAKGKVVSYLDDDMVLDKNWIQGARLVLNGQAGLVGGRILPVWEGSVPDWVEVFFSNYQGGKVLTYLGLIDLGGEVKAVDAFHAFGGNCFVRKDVILELKGYHPDSLPQEFIRYRGDGEAGFARKFTQSELVSLYDPTALAYHRINTERLTVDYLCKRSYNQGISDSFTAIRREHKLYGEPDNTSGASPGKFGKILRSVQIFKGNIYRRFIPRLRAIERVRAQTRKSYEEGFVFHQREVRGDRKLLEWVLREDYMGENGRLPV
ncbi:glycosyltransferase [Chloroflexota bacterium]